MSAGVVEQAGSVFQSFCAAGLWPGLSAQLAAGLDGVGVRGPADVTVDRLAGLPRVSRSRAERLAAGWTAASEAFAVAEMLFNAGVELRLAPAAISGLGKGAAGVLADDPWRLLGLPGVSPREADAFALRTLAPRPDKSDPRRGRAFTEYLLGRAARDGHTRLPEPTVLAGLAGLDLPDPAGAVAAAVQSGEVVAGGVPEEAWLALARYARAETAIAAGLARLAAGASPLATPEGAAAVAGELDEAQRSAVLALAAHGVSVLTGGPGTGKSRTVAAVVRLANQLDRRVALAAPTGRAAKRLEELAGAPATTLHRLLGAQGTSGEFARGADWPLDADVVVVDETSMLDVELAAALVEACPTGSRLLLVGDPAQLPSIGPGRVLGDLLDSAVLPVTRLTELHRQAQGGAIARTAAAVRDGALPPVDSADREVVVVPASDAATAAHRAVQLVTDSIPRVLGIPSQDVQVVTPVHRGPAGTIALNTALKARLNPGPGAVGGFDAGDRVVATANHLDVGFANGEVGVVSAATDGELQVVFPTGPVSVEGGALADLRHGWAITVHRSQGSEWPAVVAVLPAEAGGLLSRPLVYTAFTRARSHLSVVHAAGPALARAVGRVGARPRRTQLAELLRAEWPR